MEDKDLTKDKDWTPDKIPEENYRIHLGKMGESAGEEYLLDKGYQLLERNFRSRCGEIDRVFLDGKTLVAVEVKSRKSKSYGLPCESITNKKKKHLVNSLNSYVAFMGIKNRKLRIDVLEIFFNDEEKVVQINHIEDAVN